MILELLAIGATALSSSLPYDVWQDANCTSSDRSSSSKITAPRIIGWYDDNNEGQTGAIRLIYQVPKIPDEITPRNVAFVFTPSIEDNLLFFASKNVAVSGGSAVVQSLGEEVTPMGDLYYSKPIVLPEKKPYYIYSTGYSCDFGQESGSKIGVISSRIEWNSAVDANNFPIRVVQNDIARSPKVDAVEIGENADGIPRGTFIKVISEVPLNKFSGMSISWDGGTNQVLSDPASAVPNISGISSAFAAANVSSIFVNPPAYSLPLRSETYKPFWQNLIWLPESNRSNSSNRLITVALSGVDGKITPLQVVPKTNSTLSELLSRVNAKMLPGRIDANKIIQFGAAIWLQGNLADHGKAIESMLRGSSWFSGSQSPTTDQLILATLSSKKNEKTYLGGSFVIAQDAHANTFRDGYSFVPITIDPKLVQNSRTLGGRFEISWPSNVDIYYSPKTESRLYPITPCVDGVTCLDQTRNQANLLPEIAEGIAQNNGIWVRSNEVDNVLQKILVERSQDGGAAGRGDEYTTFKSAYTIGIRELSGANAITSEKLTMGYLDPRPILSYPIISLHPYQLGGWYNKKEFHGYSAFDEINVPVNNWVRLRYADAPNTRNASITQTSLSVLSDAFLSSMPATVVTNLPPESDGEVPRQSANEFEFKIPTYGPLPGGIELQVANLLIQGDEGKVLAPVHYYLNDKIYYLYYGGSTPQELDWNRNYAISFGEVISRKLHTYVEVLDATALHLGDKYPTTGDPYKDFATYATEWSNGVPVFDNFRKINDGVRLSVGGIAYVWSHSDGKGGIYTTCSMLKNVDGSGGIRPSDDYSYDNYFQYIKNEYLLIKQPPKHSEELRLRDIRTPGIGLWTSSSSWEVMALNGMLAVDGVVAIGKLALTGISRSISYGMLKLAVRQAIEVDAEIALKNAAVKELAKAEVTKELEKKLGRAAVRVLADEAVAAEEIALKNSVDFGQEFFEKTQQLVDKYFAALEAKHGSYLSLLDSDKKYFGTELDQLVRKDLKSWVASKGVPEGPGKDVLINRRLYNLGNKKQYRIPDARFLTVDGKVQILDYSLAYKKAGDPQIRDFAKFANTKQVTIVRPSSFCSPVGVCGSYSIKF